MSLRTLLSGLGFAIVLAVALAAQAGSVELEDAKSEGLVGERADGFVGIVVAKPSPEIAALVEAVNAKRRAAYQEIARRNGTALDAVASLAGAKLVARTPKGQWVTDAQGNWSRK
jgi:uncharacterized protein YdbL (DUF1318 family)